MNNNVLQFLNLKEINNLIDESPKNVIFYLYKKIIFNQPEPQVNEIKQFNFQIPKEFLEEWIVQNLPLWF